MNKPAAHAHIALVWKITDHIDPLLPPSCCHTTHGRRPETRHSSDIITIRSFAGWFLRLILPAAAWRGAGGGPAEPCGGLP